MNDITPHEFALLLLAAESGPPRKRARDQQADHAGLALRRQVLERLAAADPDADQIESALAEIIDQLGPPSGPTRGIAASIRDQWQSVRGDPGLLAHLLGEAVDASHAAGKLTQRK